MLELDMLELDMLELDMLDWTMRSRCVSEQRCSRWLSVAPTASLDGNVAVQSRRLTLPVKL